jgi:hypothetical protein
MKYRLLGRSELRISEAALGTMTFGDWGWGSLKDEAQRVYETAKLILASGFHSYDRRAATRTPLRRSPDGRIRFVVGKYLRDG